MKDDVRKPNPSITTSVMTTKVALVMPDEMPFDEWERTGHKLAGIMSSSSWWLGDWLIYGRAKYTDRYERAVQAAGLQYQTLRNYAWVAGRFPPARRRDAVSFQHHAEVASLPVEEQERWLQRTQEDGWSLRQLRGALRTARNAAVESRSGVRRLAVPDDHLRRWHEAAVRSGTDLEKWMFETLDVAAEQILTN